ncbi:winged helix-turn-helix transcriptional regulator [Nonomuraea sp. KC401]|uniref:MarR family winged helix-turn-helix transcriptional regulator n=1 Tax=unclassified Nonomuraea TaxID=2593643 RepID=UPI0010FE71B7|nr:MULTISPECIES: MarR family winged helix-turn-helix transcriptional regulator [unclassified Nonomuraea]NBE95009.1 MarR family transcriptional regulator [Nonomuraea sp. K271]TLF64013.1 winged helix-turn-helix transcriptional regulator [Nonomuraea sp. KC401]
MNRRDHIEQLLAAMQRDLLPSLLHVHEEDDLRLIDNVMLHVLDRGEEPTVKELAALIGRSESRTSRIVDGLVRRGLVERYEDERDRRARRIRVSAQGTALLQRIRRLRVDAQMWLWEHFTEEEAQIVLQALELFAKAARKVRDEADQAVGDRRLDDRPGGRQGSRARGDDPGR